MRLLGACACCSLMDGFLYVSLSACSHREVITFSTSASFVQAIDLTDIGDKKQAIFNLFAAYIHTIPLEELIESVERARLDAKLRYMVIYGAACSYCLARAERLDGSYLRTFALESREQLAQTLAAFFMSILTGRRGLEVEPSEPPL
jgi:hypothetical protein